MELRTPIIARLKEDWTVHREREKGLNSIMSLFDEEYTKTYITQEIGKDKNIKQREKPPQEEEEEVEITKDIRSKVGQCESRVAENKLILATHFIKVTKLTSSVYKSKNK